MLVQSSKRKVQEGECVGGGGRGKREMELDLCSGKQSEQHANPTFTFFGSLMCLEWTVIFHAMALEGWGRVVPLDEQVGIVNNILH